jgi:hypothetical protein
MAELRTMAPPVTSSRPTWSLERRFVPPMLAGWVALLLAADVFQRGLRAPTLLMVLESLAYLALYLGMLSFTPVREWVNRLPSPHRAVLAVFVFGMTWGQLVVDSRSTFPFTAWTMYARPEINHLVEYYRYRGVDRQGHEVWVDPAKEFTFVNSAEIASRVKSIGRPAASANDPAKREDARDSIRDLLHAIAAAYNRSHPDARLRSLEFVRYSWEYGKQPVSDVVPVSMLRIDLEEETAR